LRDNPCEPGYCTDVYRTDYDSVEWHLSGIGKELLSDQPLKQPFNNFSLYIDYDLTPECKNKPLTDYLSLSIYHVISEELKNIFDQYGVNAEYFRIVIVNYEGDKNYYLAHFLDVIDCLDQENSTDINRPYAPGYDVTAIQEDKIPDNVMLFREKTKNVVIVSNKLKNAVEKAGIKGILFLTLPEDGWETGKLIDKLEREYKKMQ
jgi:hypothetical protein